MFQVICQQWKEINNLILRKKRLKNLNKIDLFKSSKSSRSYTVSEKLQSIETLNDKDINKIITELERFKTLLDKLPKSQSQRSTASRKTAKSVSSKIKIQRQHGQVSLPKHTQSLTRVPTPRPPQFDYQQALKEILKEEGEYYQVLKNKKGREFTGDLEIYDVIKKSDRISNGPKFFGFIVLKANGRTEHPIWVNFNSNPGDGSIRKLN